MGGPYLQCFTLPPNLRNATANHASSAAGMRLITRQVYRHFLYIHTGTRLVMIRSGIHIYTLSQVHTAPDTHREGLNHGAGLLQ
jgi:hypothetical protein